MVYGTSVPWVLSILWFFYRPPLASAALANVSIDDTYGDPTNGNNVTYSPPEEWNYGPACTGCTAQLDSSQVYNGTWHDCSFDNHPTPNPPIVSVSANFTGKLQE